MFEIIQILRGATAPMTAENLAERLEVSARTIYRDISALQAMRTPIEGESGIGYIMRRGYDLPPLNFDEEEVEALRVGLALLSRTGDVSRASLRAAIRSESKLEITYRDEQDQDTVRILRPVGLVYHLECVMLAGWCELRAAFRHFRTDRIYTCVETGERFEGQGNTLRELWRAQTNWDKDSNKRQAEALSKSAQL